MLRGLNLLDVEVLTTNNGTPTTVRSAAGAESRVAWCSRSDVAVGTAAKLVLRPEHLLLHKGQPTDQESVQGRIVESIFQGSVVRHVVETVAGTRMTVIDTTREATVGDDGDDVWITWAEDMAHLVVAKDEIPKSTLDGLVDRGVWVPD